jgi:hypothetical protein
MQLSLQIPTLILLCVGYEETFPLVTHFPQLRTCVMCDLCWYTERNFRFFDFRRVLELRCLQSHHAFPKIGADVARRCTACSGRVNSTCRLAKKYFSPFQSGPAALSHLPKHTVPKISQTHIYSNITDGRTVERIQGKVNPVTGRGGPWSSEMSRLPHFLDN